MNNIVPTVLNEQNIIRLLDRIPIFSAIGITEKLQIARESHVEHVAKEQIVIEQDELSNNLYIIMHGDVVVMKRNKLREWAKVTTLGSGDYFGEIALLRNIPRTARVMTVTACSFLTIKGADFLKLYQFFPNNSCDNIQLMIAKRLEELKNII
jgi:CRP-like cAMP-binding protein